MGIQDIVRWILPREDHFYTFLEDLSSASHDAALALSKWTGESDSAKTVSDEVQEIEHRADKIQKDLEDALALTFVTPLDREDLHKLGSELDDIVDLTNLAARAVVLYGVPQPTEPMRKLMRLLTDCTAVLKEAVPNLRQHKYSALVEAGRTLQKAEKEGDRTYRDAISGLFHDDTIDAKTVLKQREVLEDLERAIDHCDHVGTTLSNLAVKHG